MPLIIPDQLPAAEALKEENIFTMNQARAQNQDIRPLKIIILNLMPTKIATETQLARVLANSPLQILQRVADPCHVTVFFIGTFNDCFDLSHLPHLSYRRSDPLIGPTPHVTFRKGDVPFVPLFLMDLLNVSDAVIQTFVHQYRSDRKSKSRRCWIWLNRYQECNCDRCR